MWHTHIYIYIPLNLLFTLFAFLWYVRALADIQHPVAFCSMGSRASFSTVCLCDYVWIYISRVPLRTVLMFVLWETICYSMRNAASPHSWNLLHCLSWAQVQPKYFEKSFLLSCPHLVSPNTNGGTSVSSCFLVIWGQRCMLADLIGTFSLHCKICWEAELGSAFVRPSVE